MRFNNLIILTVFSVLVYACSGATDALKGKKRSEQSDEFLVEKKSPLELPPDFSELPTPNDHKNEENTELEVKDILEIESNEKSSQETNDQQNGSLEKIILEKIN